MIIRVIISWLLIEQATSFVRPPLPSATARCRALGEGVIGEGVVDAAAAPQRVIGEGVVDAAPIVEAPRLIGEAVVAAPQRLIGEGVVEAAPQRIIGEGVIDAAPIVEAPRLIGEGVVAPIVETQRLIGEGVVLDAVPDASPINGGSLFVLAAVAVAGFAAFVSQNFEPNPNVQRAEPSPSYDAP